MNGVLPPYLLLLITLHIVNHSDRDAIAYMNPFPTSLSSLTHHSMYSNHSDRDAIAYMNGVLPPYLLLLALYILSITVTVTPSPI